MYSRCLVALAGLTLALAGGLALAQTQKPADEPLLKGPKVQEGVPGEQRQFTPGRSRGRDMMGTEIPHRAFMRALDALRGEQAEEAVRLTGEQESQIKRTNESFLTAVAKYRQEHREEFQELLPQLTPQDRKRAMEFVGRRGENRKPELDAKKNTRKKDLDAQPMTEVDPKKAEEARERLKQVMAGAPNPADTHSQVFGVLNEAQKKAFRAELEKVKSEMAKPMERPKKPEGKPAEGMRTIDDLPEGVRERIMNLPPEERRAAIRRYLDRQREDRKEQTKDEQPRPK